MTLYPEILRVILRLLLSALLLPGAVFAAPDAYLDVQAAIAQPHTSAITGGGLLDEITKNKARLNIYRTSVSPRVGILIRVEGFGSSGVDTNTSNGMRLPKGGDKDHIANPDYAMAQDLGFDIYLVEWYNGTSHIQKNAMVITELLRLIREGGLQGEEAGAVPEDVLGPDEKLVLLGESMGGLVTRFALAYLEQGGIDHRVDLWMTADSPHAGAYIPIGVQYLVNDLNQLTAGLAAREQLDDIDSPAAQQMLLYHHLAAHVGSTPPHSPLFDLFWDELNTVYGGYPQALGLWRAALSNGRDDGRTAELMGTSDVSFNLPKSEARLLAFELSTDTVMDRVEALKMKVFGRTAYEAEIKYSVTLGTSMDVWSLRPHLENGPVYTRRTGLIFKMAGKRIAPTTSQIVQRLEEILHIPSWISDGIVVDALTDFAEEVLDVVDSVVAGVPQTTRVDADYAWEFAPGGLDDKISQAGVGLKLYVNSVDVISPRHCFIPATSSLGLPGYPLLPLKNLTAQDTPFDAIYAEPPDPGNRTHVQYNKKNGIKAFEFEMNRVLTVPSVSGFATPRLPEGTPSQAVSASGINFTSNTVAYWNGSPRATHFISENEVLISLTDLDLSTPAIADITLSDPVSPVTGMSTTQFEVVDLDLRVTPAFPVPGDTVHINYSGLYKDGGVPESPSATLVGTNITLEATIPSGNFFFVLSPYELDVDVGPLTGGTYQVTYQEYNGPVTKSFNVHNPAPVISEVSPSVVTSGTQYVQLRLQGEGFLRDFVLPSNTLSQVTWNEETVPATILNSGLLAVEVEPDLLGTLRTNVLTVVNPGPGGGTNQVEVLYLPPMIAAATLATTSPTENSLLLRVDVPDLGEGATVWWNGAPLATERGLDGDLVALVLPNRLPYPGQSAITVVDSNGWESTVHHVEFLPPPNARYVKPNTPGGDDGDSWETAYDDLQTALAAAVAGDELWVAEGVYVPSTDGNPSNSFALVDGVALYGGFKGGEVLRAQRNADPFSNQTVLSGDQFQDGWATSATRVDNSYHVVTCDNLTDTTILDGFTITGANGSFAVTGRDSNGGGIGSLNSSPQLRNLWIIDNIARYGGGMSIEGGEPVFVQVTFTDNAATFGGGLRVSYGGARLTDVDFVENGASFRGGGMDAQGGDSTLERVRFLGNSGQDGGGLHAFGRVTIRNGLFAGNQGVHGGAIYHGMSSPGARTWLAQVTISGNRATDKGGAIWNQTVGPLLDHCVLWSNTALQDSEITGVPLDAASTYNTIQGGHPAGSSTFTNDPRFVRTPDSGDGSWWSRNDNDYGNLRLRADSPVLDVGDTNLVPVEVVTDLAGHPRIDGAGVDLGAYEGGFVTFADFYPHLQPQDDANLDGAANVLPYLYGEDPQGLLPVVHKPRLVREGDRLYFEFVVRVMAGDYWLAMDASDGLPDWHPLPEDLGHAMVLDEVADWPGGIQWRRVRLLIDPSSPSPGFIHSYALPRHP